MNKIYFKSLCYIIQNGIDNNEELSAIYRKCKEEKTLTFDDDSFFEIYYLLQKRAFLKMQLESINRIINFKFDQLEMA